jgi:hypothetical protein
MMKRLILKEKTLGKLEKIRKDLDDIVPVDEMAQTIGGSKPPCGDVCMVTCSQPCRSSCADTCSQTCMALFIFNYYEEQA